MIRQRAAFESLTVAEETGGEGEEKNPSRWLESLPSSVSVNRLLAYVGPKVS